LALVNISVTRITLVTVIFTIRNGKYWCDACTASSTGYTAETGCHDDYRNHCCSQCVCKVTGGRLSPLVLC